tara:strand:- start:8597 stop:8869 length:273 start_codon:yes stop_codon:yes gene_type:complete
MKQVFKIFGMHQQNIVNEVSLSSNGLDVTQDFGVVLFEAMNNNGFTNEFNTELEAVEKLQQMERDDFFSSWLGFEIKRIFVVSESQIDNK